MTTAPAAARSPSLELSTQRGPRPSRPGPFVLTDSMRLCALTFESYTTEEIVAIARHIAGKEKIARLRAGKAVIGRRGCPVAFAANGFRHDLDVRRRCACAQPQSAPPHDHARSHAYRWGADGLSAFCDIEQGLCLSRALWNGPRFSARSGGWSWPQVFG